MEKTTHKYEIEQKINNDDTLIVHLVTDADIVNYEGKMKEEATTVESAIDKLKDKVDDIVNGGVVTGIKGDKEQDYSTGKYNITPSKIGAYTTTETDTKITQAITPVNELAQEAKTIAEGRSRAKSFENLAELTTALKAASATEYKVGDNLFIKATNEPDYWVTDVLETNEGTYGYYQIQILETKIDLTSYQTKTDNGLTTTSKSVVGAINETSDLAKATQTELGEVSKEVDSLSDELAGIVSGTTPSGTASKLEYERQISVSGAVTGSVNFDGSKDVIINTTIPNGSIETVKLKNIENLVEGVYTAVKVNTKGQVVQGAQSIYVGQDDEATPPESLAIGGLFFRKLS